MYLDRSQLNPQLAGKDCYLIFHPVYRKYMYIIYGPGSKRELRSFEAVNSMNNLSFVNKQLSPAKARSFPSCKVYQSTLMPPNALAFPRTLNLSIVVDGFTQKHHVVPMLHHLV